MRIRKLQDVMRLDLEHIRTMLRAEDRLQELRWKYAAGDEERQREIVNEAGVGNAEEEDAWQAGVPGRPPRHPGEGTASARTRGPWRPRDR